MTRNGGVRPGTAFVLMPFDLLSDWIFQIVIRPELEAGGYVAKRADSSLGVVAIMQDIVQGITDSDLIVADLTGRNPNVFYELGIAHALRKDVLMIARSSQDIPFDLAAYRTVVYSVALPETGSFAVESTLTNELRRRLEAIRQGGMAFSSPFADFSVQDASSPPERGLLDDARAFRDGVQPYLATIYRLVAVMTHLSDEMRLDAARGVPNGDPLDFAAATYTAFAPSWLGAAEAFETVVRDELHPQTLLIERGAVAFLRLGSLRDDDPVAREAYLGSLDEMSRAAAEYVPMFRELAATVRTYAKLTGPLVAPGARLAAAIDQVANLFGEVASVGDRVRKETG